MSKDALTQEDWNARYLDGFNNLIPPGMNGAVPDQCVFFSKIDKFIENFGKRVDRLGGPDGEFLTILGGNYDQRGHLPDAVSAKFHAYEFTGELPDHWEVELAKTAPIFGRAGGAMYVVVLSANGQKLSIQELLDVGVLNELNS